MDGQVTDERYTRDWNPIWEVRPGRFEDGWTFEAAIPFKSLRYRPGRSQVWSFNVQRNVRRKNESSYLVPMPAARGLGAMNQVSLAGTLVGLEAPEGTQTLELKPFVTGDLTSDRVAIPPVSNALPGVWHPKDRNSCSRRRAGGCGFVDGCAWGRGTARRWTPWGGYGRGATTSCGTLVRSLQCERPRTPGA